MRLDLLISAAALFLIGEKMIKDNFRSPDDAEDKTTASLLDKGLDFFRDALTPDGKADPYLPAISAAENRHGIPSGMLFRLLYAESRFRPDIIDGRTVSSVGALGIAQFMPATAQERGVNPLDPYNAIEGAASYLASLRRSLGTWREAVAAYNWGMGNVRRKGLAAMPAETRKYVSFIYDQGGFNA